MLTKDQFNSIDFQNYSANLLQDNIVKNLTKQTLPKIKNSMVEEQEKTNNKLTNIQYENMKLNSQIKTQNKLIDSYIEKIEDLQSTNNKLNEINQTLIDNNKYYWIYSTIVTIIGAVIGFLLGKYFT